MCEIISQLLEFARKKSTAPLQQYILSVEDEKLIKSLQNRLPSPDFVIIWDKILQALADTDELQHKRFKIFLAVLREIERVQLPSAHNDLILTRLIMDLPSFSTEHLVELCSYCTESIQVGKFTGNGYKELMPNLLNVVMERDIVEHNNVEITGVEYKKQFLNTLTMLEWSPNIIIALTSLFIEMPLNVDEHVQIVSKLCQYMKKLTPQEMPAFVYQLLNLCQNQNGRFVFIRLQQYFTPLYKQISVNFSSESSIDLIESSSNIDMFEAENTILFYIHQVASLGRDSVNDYLNCLKNLLKAPEYILHPFHLTVLLSIFKIAHFEDKITEILKSSISRTLHEEHKKAQSLWLRELVPNIDNLEVVFTQIIENSIKGRHLVIEGTVHFAFLLLNVGAMLGRDPIAEKQWQLGIFILLKIIKRKSNITPFVIKTLSNHIFTAQNVTQHIDCVYFISKRLTLHVMENQSSIKEMMENLLEISGNIANQLLEAIIPIAKISSTMRDYLIILLRKALFSRSVDTRQMAVMGFLKLLKNLRISNLAVLSQSSISSGSFSSGHSVLTQISLNTQSQLGKSMFSNEEFCLQVLNILKCCFMQQVEVRAQFYEGLYDAVCHNPDLGIPVLKIIWLHFSQFYVTDKDTLPPLQFSKISSVKDLDVVLEEPLGQLIYTIGLTISKVLETDNENEENNMTREFVDELESLCTRMINCELIHFELDDGTDLLDIVPESQQKLLVLKEALIVYEALIGYKIISWVPNSENNAQHINQLFQGYSRLVQFSKNLTKPKKAETKKKKQDSMVTSTQLSNVSTKQDSSHKSMKGFKLPDTVLTFPVIVKAISLLHSVEVSWATNAQVISIKTKPEIHRHVIQATIHLVQATKYKQIIQTEQAKTYYNYLMMIGSIIYERCIERLNDFIDFDPLTAVLATECFYLILNTICSHYKSYLVLFLGIVGHKEDGKDLIVHLTGFIETYQKLFQTDDEDESYDGDLKKLPLIIINTLQLLCNQIPSENNALALQVLDWMKNFANDKTLSNKQEALAFVNLFFDMHIKYKNTLTLLENFSKRTAVVMGVIEGEKINSEEIKLINELTVHTVLMSICGSIKSLLDEINWMIMRIKSEHYALTYPGEESIEKRREHLKTKERAICCQLCILVSILSTLSVLMVHPGPIWEAVLKNLAQLYNTLNSLAKYFTQRSSKNNLVFQAARFEYLVKLAGKQLSPNIYKLIIYVEESQKPETQVTQPRKKSVGPTQMKTKILRDTKSIPKLIYEIEQFSKSVIQLSKKTAVDLSRYVGQGTTRDFRIKDLKVVIEQTEDEMFSHEQSHENNATELDANFNESSEEDSANDTGEESSPPPSKKAKL